MAHDGTPNGHTMTHLRLDGDALERVEGQEILRIEPWGRDSVRVRVAMNAIRDDVPHALLAPKPAEVSIEMEGNCATVVNGSLSVEVTAKGHLRFLDTGSGAELLAEDAGHFQWPGPRSFRNGRDGYARLEQRFAAYEARSSSDWASTPTAGSTRKAA